MELVGQICLPQKTYRFPTTSNQSSSLRASIRAGGSVFFPLIRNSRNSTRSTPNIAAPLVSPKSAKARVHARKHIVLGGIPPRRLSDDQKEEFPLGFTRRNPCILIFEVSTATKLPASL